MIMLTWLFNQLASAAKAFSKIPPTFLKGFVSIVIAFLIFQQMWFGSDEAAKWIEAKELFWLNWILGSMAIIANSCRDVLSAHYNEKSIKREGASNDTTIFNKPS